VLHASPRLILLHLLILITCDESCESWYSSLCNFLRPALTRSVSSPQIVCPVLCLNHMQITPFTQGDNSELHKGFRATQDLPRENLPVKKKHPKVRSQWSTEWGLLHQVEHHVSTVLDVN
jgi:hypothetical protein